MTSPPEGGRWGPAQRERERALLAELHSLPADDPRRDALRDELVVMHLPLVRHLARRYRDRGEQFEDLVQVGTVGLIKAVDRFDPDRGAAFSTFATPTILGEIKRHFRDSARAVHVPRRLQELHAAVARATEAMTQSLGRSPTVRELAAELDISEDEVLEAIEVRHAFAASSLDATAADGTSEGAVLADLLGDEDSALAAIEDRESLRPLLEALPERERQIIMLRFFRNQSQSQIAEQLGISQMHVSRLLARTLAQLRDGLAA